MVDGITVEEAVKTLTDALKSDAGLLIAYQSNIAMAFVDEMFRFKAANGKRPPNRREIHQIAITAADNFLALLSQ